MSGTKKENFENNYNKIIMTINEKIQLLIKKFPKKSQIEIKNEIIENNQKIINSSNSEGILYFFL
jgi:hypothetical protein